jgi:hypothetical protein
MLHDGNAAAAEFQKKFIDRASQGGVREAAIVAGAIALDRWSIRWQSNNS